MNDDPYPHILMSHEARRRRGILMHPADIIAYYNSRYLDKPDQEELFALQLNLQEQFKDHEEKKRQRLLTIQIKHDLLEATKRERELEARQKILKPVPVVEEEKPEAKAEAKAEPEEPKEEPVLVRPIIVVRRKKKKEQSY